MSFEEVLQEQESETRRHNARLFQLLITLSNKKRWLLIGGLCLAVPVALLGIFLRPTYTAELILLPPATTRPAASLFSMQSAGDLGSLSGMVSPFQAKVQADFYVGLLHLDSMHESVARLAGTAASGTDDSITNAARLIEKQTQVESTKDGLIHIAVTDADAARSARIANAFPIALQSLMTHLSLTEAASRRQFYEGQLARTKADLTAAEAKFQQMQQSSHMIALDSQAKTLLDQASNLSAQVRAKEVELQQVESYSTDANAQVQLLKTQIAALRGQLAQVESRSSGGGYSGSALSNVPQAEVEFVRATRELKYQEGLYDVMVRQYESSIIDEAKDAPGAQVVQAASVPHKPSGPHRLRNTLIAFLVGAFGGLLASLLRYLLDSSTPDTRGFVRQLRSSIFSWR